MICRCDPTRGQSCRRCDGTDPRTEAQIEAAMDVRDYGSEDDGQRAERANDAMVYGGAR